jgi:hypothetical protein
MDDYIQDDQDDRIHDQTSSVDQTGEARHWTAKDDTERLPAGSSLHPRVYTIVIGLTAWFVLAVWLFAGGGLSDYLLFVVSGFMFVCIALTLILSCVTTVEKLPTGEPPRRERSVQQSLHDWARSTFGTWGGSLNGKQAMVQVLLPFAAAAVGMTVIGILFHFAEHAAA